MVIVMVINKIYTGQKPKSYIFVCS